MCFKTFFCLVRFYFTLKVVFYDITFKCSWSTRLRISKGRTIDEENSTERINKPLFYPISYINLHHLLSNYWIFKNYVNSFALLNYYVK